MAAVLAVKSGLDLRIAVVRAGIDEAFCPDFEVGGDVVVSDQLNELGITGFFLTVMNGLGLDIVVGSTETDAVGKAVSDDGFPGFMF